MAKNQAPIIGHACQYDRFQFVYDLWVWSTIGAAKHATTTPSGIALSGRPCSPEYWRRKHAGLLDMQRQLGYPKLFITIAPYEWSLPHHAWIEYEFAKIFCAQLYLPAAETMQSQAVINYICCFKKKGRWENNNTENVLNIGTVVTIFFLRIEFQDGKRKRHQWRRPQSYHGRGSPHIHALDGAGAHEHFAISSQRNCDRHDAADAMFDSWFSVQVHRKRLDD